MLPGPQPGLTVSFSQSLQPYLAAAGRKQEAGQGGGSGLRWPCNFSAGTFQRCRARGTHTVYRLPAQLEERGSQLQAARKGLGRGRALKRGPSPACPTARYESPHPPATGSVRSRLSPSLEKALVFSSFSSSLYRSCAARPGASTYRGRQFSPPQDSNRDRHFAAKGAAAAAVAVAAPPPRPTPCPPTISRSTFFRASCNFSSSFTSPAAAQPRTCAGACRKGVYAGCVMKAEGLLHARSHPPHTPWAMYATNEAKAE